MSGPDYPKKKRDLHSHHFDSTIWDDVEFRDDDIVISTYAKAGTTWLQQIISQLIFNGREGLEVAAMSPWVDLRVPPKEVKLAAMAEQTHRRFMKSHLPVDALVFSPKAKYVYIGRDGRDVVWSLYNHHANANATWYDALNNTPGRVGPPIEAPPESVHQYYRDWFERDGYPFWSFWENVRSWWAVRTLPNVHFVHFQSLKKDMASEIRAIADFLEIPIEEDLWDDIVHHCTFDYMKRNADKSVPLGGAFWEGGAKTFVHKGTNGRWRDTLTPRECAEYEQRAIDELGEDCAAWLATGQHP